VRVAGHSFPHAELEKSRRHMRKWYFIGEQIKAPYIQSSRTQNVPVVDPSSFCLDNDLVAEHMQAQGGHSSSRKSLGRSEHAVLHALAYV
jgi:hypothetical protein